MAETVPVPVNWHITKQKCQLVRSWHF